MTEKAKVFGYNAKILKVDLTERRISIDQPNPGFYRTYLGGSLLGAYYLFKETRTGVDPLSPDNIIIFTPSITTGAAVSGASRFTIVSKSPLTGAIGETQCGGDWGPKLKHAGFDAVVIQGKADTPVFLWISNGKAEIRDAARLWGKITGEAQALIRKELEDESAQIAQIGPAGENLVRFACVTGGLSHFAGRTGMGAVMGSKNLKAIAVQGKKTYSYFNEEEVNRLGKKGAAKFKESEIMQKFQLYGTSLGVEWNEPIGNIVTRNFQSGNFEEVKELMPQKYTESILHKNDTCWGCVVRCKRVVELEKPYKVDGKYGGPEFEAMVMLGSNLGISDLKYIAKANEICNQYTMDCISAGAMIGFAMECFENGIIDSKDTDGIELHFGNKEGALRALEMIANREGIGEVLADGYPRAISQWGEACREFAVHVKNQSYPAHMPRTKPSQSLIYAVNPCGADHMSSEHDWIAINDDDVSRGLGISDFTDWGSLNDAKVAAVMKSQFYYSLLDVLAVCAFPWGPGSIYSYADILDFVNAVTGWNVTFWELLRAGERKINLAKAFNLREGLDSSQDALAKRSFDPLRGGASDGKKIDKIEHKKAVALYYAMMNWDEKTGAPTKAKLIELGLSWVAEALVLD